MVTYQDSCSRFETVILYWVPATSRPKAQLKSMNLSLLLLDGNNNKRYYYNNIHRNNKNCLCAAHVLNITHCQHLFPSVSVVVVEIYVKKTTNCRKKNIIIIDDDEPKKKKQKNLIKIVCKVEISWQRGHQVEKLNS